MNWIASTLLLPETAPSPSDGLPPHVVAAASRQPAPCSARKMATTTAAVVDVALDRGRPREQSLLRGEEPKNKSNKSVRGGGEGRRGGGGGGGGEGGVRYRRTRGLAEPRDDLRDDEPPPPLCARTLSSSSSTASSSRSVPSGSSPSEESWRPHRSSGNSGEPLRGSRSSYASSSSSSSAFRAGAGGAGGTIHHGAFERVPRAAGDGAAAPPAGAAAGANSIVQWHVHAYMDATQTLLFQVQQGPAPPHPPSSSLHHVLSPSSQILSSEEIGAFVRKRLLAGDGNPTGSGRPSPLVSHTVHMSSDSSCWNHPLVQCLQSWIDGAGASGGSGSAPTSPAPPRRVHSEVNSSVALSASSEGGDDDATDSDDEITASRKGAGSHVAASVTASAMSRRGGGANSTVVGRLGRSLRRQVARAVSRSRSRAPSLTARSRTSCGASQSQSQCPSRSKNSRAASKSDAAGGPHQNRGMSSRHTTCGDTQAATADEDTVHAVVVPCPYRAAIPPPCRDPRAAASRGGLPRQRPKRPAGGRHADDGDGTARPGGGAAAGVVVPVATTFRSRRRDDDDNDRGDPAQPGRSRRGRSFSRRVPGLGGGGSSVGGDGFGRRAVNQDQGDWI